MDMIGISQSRFLTRMAYLLFIKQIKSSVCAECFYRYRFSSYVALSQLKRLEISNGTRASRLIESLSLIARISRMSVRLR